jgi:selenocysteine lyase/cysteine desulfurase
MHAALTMFQGLGVENIQRHNYDLIDRLADYLKGDPFYTITSSLEDKHRSSIFTFTCDGFEELHRELLRKRIICVQREGSIRLSIHLFNDESDIGKVIEVLAAFSEGE